jgi:hypothetical protein
LHFPARRIFVPKVRCSQASKLKFCNFLFILFSPFFLFFFFSCASKPPVDKTDENVSEGLFSDAPSLQDSLADEPPDIIPPSINTDSKDTDDKKALDEPQGIPPPELPEIVLPPEPQYQDDTVAQGPLPLPPLPLIPDPPPVPPEPVPQILEPPSPALTVPAPQTPAAEPEVPAPAPSTGVSEIPPEPPPIISFPDPIAEPEEEEEKEIAVRPKPFVPEPPAIPPVLEEEKIVLSRTVRVLAGQMIEIPFRGTGWVYLGEIGSRRGVSYDSRRLDPEGQTFIFRAETPGTYVLKFYKQDFIRDYVLNDYVQVVVGEAPGSGEASPWVNPPSGQSRVAAEPRWPLIDGSTVSGNLPPVPPAGNTETRPVQDAQFPEPADAGHRFQPPGSQDLWPDEPGVSAADPGDYIRRAKTEFDAGRIVPAFSILDEMKRHYPELNDEALWLYGQLLEANSPNRDIKQALDCYKRLIQEYPQSLRIPEAQRRIAYLERYYFNIR